MDPHCPSCGRSHAVTLPWSTEQCAVTRYYASTELPDDTVLAETPRACGAARYDAVPREPWMVIEAGLL